MTRWIMFHPATGIPFGVIPAADRATALAIARDRHGVDVDVRPAYTQPERAKS